MNTLLGLIIIAGSIISSILALGGLQSSPQWLKITAGILNIIFIISFIGITTGI